MRVRNVIILGSTGSIGTQSLAFIAKNSEVFRVVGLAAGSNRELAMAQAIEHSLPSSQVAFGVLEAERLIESTPADVILNGITGSVGLGPTLAALHSGATLALANKESLIVGGELVKNVQQRPDQIVPVDSEHSALAQALLGGTHNDVSRLILTASGGPFRGKSREELKNVGPADALAHPTWSMGKVITTNSATLVNKGLEVIEAHLLFDVPYEKIAVTVHPQSVVHSMVEFVDGSILAQCSPPDMRLPISLGLNWPHRTPGVIDPVDFGTSHTWTFEPLDEQVFDSVSVAKQVGVLGGTYPAVFNAANEQAVYAFHRGELAFLDILEVVREVVESHQGSEMTLEAVLQAENEARLHADAVIAKKNQ